MGGIEVSQSTVSTSSLNCNSCIVLKVCDFVTMGTYSWDLLDALLYASPNTRQLYAYYYVNVGLHVQREICIQFQ